jgi:muramoyltetrapeptide carboxypeptidase
VDLVLPPRLRDGDTVAIIAPAGPVNRTRLARGLDLLGAHFRPRVMPAVHHVAGFLAGPDAARADDVNAALRDPDVRAIAVARGGYGIMRILPLLDEAALRADPKPIIGFSDATALLSWAARAGVRGIHGPTVSQLAELPAGDVAALHRALTDPAPPGALPWALTATGATGGGQKRGVLVGGNLTLLAHLVGTPWQVPAAGAIVVIEDIGETPYAVDRYLTRMLLAGAWDGAAAALVGDFTRCTEAPTPVGGVDDPRAAMAVVAERLTALGVPGLAGAPIGHGSRNLAWPWAARCTLDLDAGTAAILDGAVA